MTSVNDSEAQNYGLKEHLAHDARYDRADEFLEATTGLWDTWDDDALVLDRATPLFADPAKVHELDYDGEWFTVRGPLDRAALPAGPAGPPAGRLVGPGPGVRRPLGGADLHRGSRTSTSPARTTRTRRRRSASAGATPTRSRCCPWPTRSSASRKAHAEEREQLFLNDLVDPMASLTLLSELMNYDFSGPGARRTDHRRAHRVGVGHPGSRAEHQDAHRRRHGDAGRPGRAPGHPAARPALRRHRARTSPTRWRRGSTAAPATASSSRPRTRRAPTRTSSASWCPSCSAGACSGTRYTGHDAARASRPGAPGVVARCLTPRSARCEGLRVDRRRHAGRRADGGDDAGRVRRRGDQGRAAGRRRPAADLGRAEGRHRPVLEEHEPQQAVRHARPAQRRRARSCSTACSTSATSSS